MLQQGANPSALTQHEDENWSVLHFAIGAQENTKEIITILLEYGANINDQSNYQKNTPLHDAAISLNVEAVRGLLQHGANKNLLNGTNHTPLQYIEIISKNWQPMTEEDKTAKEEICSLLND